MIMNKVHEALNALFARQPLFSTVKLRSGERQRRDHFVLSVCALVHRQGKGLGEGYQSRRQNHRGHNREECGDNFGPSPMHEQHHGQHGVGARGDLPIKVVAFSDMSYGLDKMVVTKDINSVEEFKGKTFGADYGFLNHMWMLLTLKRAGIDQKESAPRRDASPGERRCIRERRHRHRRELRSIRSAVFEARRRERFSSPA